MKKYYATVWAKDKDTGFITEDQCKRDDDVASYVCDSDYEIIKIEYHQEAAQRQAELQEMYAIGENPND